MQGTLANRSTTPVEYFHIGHMKRLSYVTLAQFFHTGSATYLKHKPQICLLLGRDLLKVKWPHTSDSAHKHKLISLKHCLLLLNSVRKCLKSFSEMNSTMPPAAEMTLGLYGLKRKTNQPTKAVSETRCPSRGELTCQKENKASHQGPLTQWETCKENDV